MECFIKFFIEIFFLVFAFYKLSKNYFLNFILVNNNLKWSFFCFLTKVIATKCVNPNTCFFLLQWLISWMKIYKQLYKYSTVYTCIWMLNIDTFNIPFFCNTCRYTQHPYITLRKAFSNKGESFLVITRTVIYSPGAVCILFTELVPQSLRLLSLDILSQS